VPLRLLFALALAVRVALLLQHPGIYGDDSAARLAYADRLVLAYQLPLPQLLVVVMRWLAPHPAWTQLVFAAIGAGVAPLLAAVVTRLESPLAGRVAGALAAVHPAFVYYSLVPYQEAPMLVLLLAAVLALLHARDGVAAPCVGLACLCRYEAWIAAALLVAWRRSRASALFTIVPIAWVVFWRGLSPGGTYVLDLDPHAGRLHRLGFLLAKTADYAGALLLVLGAVGGAWVLWRGDRRWRAAAAFAAVFVAAVVVAGHEFPPGSGRVSERLVHLPALATCAGAGVVLARLSPRRPWLAAAITAILAVDGSRRARALVAAAHDAPDVRLAQSVAAFVERRLGAGAHVAVDAPAVAAADVEAYVRKVQAAGGDAARARATARELSRLPPDAVRVAAQLARPPGTVVPIGEEAALLAVFDGAPRAGRPVAEFHAGSRRAVVYWAEER